MAGVRKRDVEKRGGSNVEKNSLGREFLKKQLLAFQKEILILEAEIKSGKPGSRLGELKKSVQGYNEALEIIFGESDALCLPHYRIRGNSLETYVPKVESKITPKTFDVAKHDEGSKKTQGPLPVPIGLYEKGFRFDSHETALALWIADVIYDAPPKEISYVTEESVAQGSAYVVVADLKTGRYFSIPFVLKSNTITQENDLYFINLTVQLYLSCGYPVVLVVNPLDFKNGIVGPKNGKSRFN